MEKSEKILMYRYYFDVPRSFWCRTFEMEDKGGATLKLIREITDKEVDEDYKPSWVYIKKVDLETTSKDSSNLSITDYFVFQTLTDTPEHREQFIEKCIERIFDDIVKAERNLANYKEVLKIKLGMDNFSFETMRIGAEFRLIGKALK